MAYFENLPLISYNGSIARNLLAKARLTDASKKQNMVYHPYTMRDDDRPDILADRYYDDPSYAWLVWFSNEIIDPYYDLGLTDDDFLSYIENKYQSVARAMSTTMFYRNAWLGDETRLTQAQYNSLNQNVKKYYDPILNEYGIVDGYRRKQKEMIRSTNKIISLTVSSVNGTFNVGEKITYTSGGNISAYAFVTYVDATTITAQHVWGSFSAGNTVVGSDSAATATVSSQTLLQQLISDIEYPFWEAVSMYDYEHELNQKKKNILLIDNQFKSAINNEMKRVMG